MKLYHYTSILHLIKILEEGYLKTTESNADSIIEHAKADVVWLTSNKNPLSEKSIENMYIDKKQVKFTVNMNAVQYLQWAKNNNVDEEVVGMLNYAGGGQSKKWFVTEEPIYKSRWLQIELYDYSLNRWVIYSEELHARLIGKLLLRLEDGKIVTCDEKSSFLMQILKELKIDNTTIKIL